jgi:hypothetical protein
MILLVPRRGGGLMLGMNHGGIESESGQSVCNKIYNLDLTLYSTYHR